MVKIKANSGAIKKSIKFLLKGIITWLKNNLIASENGWKIPLNPTFLGPTRYWEILKTFRSKSVIKATLTKIGITIIK